MIKLPNYKNPHSKMLIDEVIEVPNQRYEDFEAGAEEALRASHQWVENFTNSEGGMTVYK